MRIMKPREDAKRGLAVSMHILVRQTIFSLGGSVSGGNEEYWANRRTPRKDFAVSEDEDHVDGVKTPSGLFAVEIEADVVQEVIDLSHRSTNEKLVISVKSN